MPTIVGVDSSDGVRRAAETGVAISIEIDSGVVRSGVAPNDAGELASLARPLGLRVNGVFTFPGHGYGLGAARSSAAADEGRLLDAPQPATWTGRRDRALLTLAVQTGLRISELTTLSTSDIHTGPGAT